MFLSIVTSIILFRLDKGRNPYELRNKAQGCREGFFLICSLEAAHFRIENLAMGLNKSRFRKPASVLCTLNQVYHKVHTFIYV